MFGSFSTIASVIHKPNFTAASVATSYSFNSTLTGAITQSTYVDPQDGNTYAVYTCIGGGTLALSGVTRSLTVNVLAVGGGGGGGNGNGGGGGRRRFCKYKNYIAYF